jgi:hypothetical protein
MNIEIKSCPEGLINGKCKTETSIMLGITSCSFTLVSGFDISKDKTNIANHLMILNIILF